MLVSEFLISVTQDQGHRCRYYVVLGLLVERAVLTVVQQISAEQQTEAAAMLIQLLQERLQARRIPRGDPRPVAEHRRQAARSDASARSTCQLHLACKGAEAE